MLEHVGIGGDEAGPGLEVGVGVRLGIEAREEGEHPVEGQPQQADTHPPGYVLCGHIVGSFPVGFGSLLELGAAYGVRCPAVTRQVSQSARDNMSRVLLDAPNPYSPECVEGEFPAVRTELWSVSPCVWWKVMICLVL